MAQPAVRKSFRRQLVYVLCLSCLGVLVGSRPAQAQGKASGTYLTEAVTRVTNLAGIAKLGNYGYNHDISILAGWVQKGGSLSFNLQLDAGAEYLFLAGGDNDAIDVDLEILDKNGKVVASDMRPDPEAIVTFRPRDTGRYTLRLILDRSQKNVPCVCVATILKKGGWNVPFGNLDKATGNLTKLLADVDRAIAQKANKRLDLRNANNQWAVFGAVLPQGQQTTVTHMTLGQGDRLFVGVGDGNASHLDLFLLDSKNKQIKGPQGQLDTPFIVYRPGTGTHGLRIQNRSSFGPTLVMMAVMDVRD
jgi:hypothetical protein